MAVDTVFFDLDDTLYDHRHARLAGMQALRRAEPALGRHPLAVLDRSFERWLKDIHIGLVLTGQISLEESRWLRMHRFLDEYHFPASRKKTQDLVDLRVRAYDLHRRAVPGAAALLRSLHEGGKTICVVTDNLRSQQEEKLRFMGFEGWVDHLVCSEDLGVTKPDPRMFHTALRLAGSRPPTTVMVGDAWEYDVVGAARVGIRPIWFHRDARPLPTSPPADELRSFRPLARARFRILRGRLARGNSRPRS